MMEKDELQNLSIILSKIQDLYYKKKEQLEGLNTEIFQLKDIIQYLSSIVSNKSFRGADEIYMSSLNQAPKDFFKEEVLKDEIKGTMIKRKIFATENDREGELLCLLKFMDFNKIVVKFLNPEKLAIEETSERFINILLKGALVQIKEEIADLELNYEYLKNSNIIEYINISNVRSIKHYDLVTSKVQELLLN